MKLILSDLPLSILMEKYQDMTYQDMIYQDIKYIDLSALNIKNCVGCFSCWTKTPGKCVIRDDATMVYPEIAKSDTVLYISHIKYGGYDTIMKTMLERAIPIQQAFIRILDGETHHVQRDVKLKKATIIAYGENLSDEEKAVFQQLVARNAHNMNFAQYKIVFTTKEELETIVENEVEQWGK